MATRGHEIIAGYDGSSGSADALDWAVREAGLRGVPVTVCHAWTLTYGPEQNGTPTDTVSAAEPVAAPGDATASAHEAASASGPAPAPGRTLTAPSAGPEGPARDHAEQVLADGFRRAQGSAAAGEVRPLLVCGPAARVLCERSVGADMLVVGSRGVGGLAGLLLGSVSLQVAAYAQAPVTVVRGRWRPVPGHYPAPVVVGADGSAASTAALELAIAEAALRDVPLIAVCALSDSAGLFGIARSVEADFGAAVDRVQAAHPGVVVQRRVDPGAPRSALLAAASAGQLLVVGARGRGGLREMMLGSVSMAILQHATCPVTVVHQG